MLARVEHAFEAHDSSVLSVDTWTPSPEVRAATMELVAEARAEIAAAAAAFQIRPHERNGWQQIAAALASAWEVLEDTRPEKLRRYGPVRPELAERLAPHIERLLELIERIRRSALSQG